MSFGTLHDVALVRTDILEGHQGNDTHGSSQLVARICLMMGCEENLLRGTPESNLSLTVEFLLTVECHARGFPHHLS
jgi:hypothetical protein